MRKRIFKINIFKLLSIFFFFNFFYVEAQKIKSGTTNSNSKARRITPAIINGRNALLVVNPGGANLKARPDSIGRTLKKYFFGELVYVGKVREHWIEVEDTQKDIAGYIPVYALGNIEDISWDERDILNENNSYGSFKLQFVSAGQFMSKSKKNANHFISDSSQFKKHNGVLELKTNHEPVRFIDYYKGTTDKYFYLGQYKFMNACTVLSVGWENYRIMLLDQSSGKLLFTFEEFPYIMTDKRHIFFAYSSLNYGSQGSGLDLYELQKDTIKHMETAAFENWDFVNSSDFPLGNFIFSGDDNSLYMAIKPANFSADAYFSKRKLKRFYKYIKVTLVTSP